MREHDTHWSVFLRLETLSSLLWNRALNLRLNQQFVVSTHKRLCTGMYLCPHASNHHSTSFQLSIYLERTGLYQTTWDQVAHLLAGVRRLGCLHFTEFGRWYTQIVGHLCCDADSNAIASLVSAKFETSSPRSTACGTC